MNEESRGEFAKSFELFWKDKCPITYFAYGSRLKKEMNIVEPTLSKKQIEIKNSPNFYQSAPFLTIAEDLLKLIKEDKVERLIFLSAYDKRIFPNGDERKGNM